MASSNARNKSFYDSKLEEFKDIKVSLEGSEAGDVLSYHEFCNRIEDFVGQMNSIVSNKQDRVESKKQEKQNLIEQYGGNDELESIRDEGNGRWNFDILQVSQVDRQIKHEERDIKEFNRIISDFKDLKSDRLKNLIDGVDHNKVDNRVLERVKEFQREEMESTEERMKSRIDDLRKEIDYLREKERRERMRNQQEMIDFMREVLRQSGLDKEDVGGEKMSDISQPDLIDEDDVHSDLFSEDEPEQEDDGSGGPGSNIASTSKRADSIRNELRKFLEGKSEFDTQAEIADEYGVDDSRVSKIKRELDDAE